MCAGLPSEAGFFHILLNNPQNRSLVRNGLITFITRAAS